MKPIKGLSRDNSPAEQPEGTYPYAKNGIQYESGGAVMNEPGFQQMLAVIPYRFNGVIETDDKPVVFSTNNTHSAIGYFNPVTELYEPIVDDNPAHLINFPASGELIGLHLDYYVRGQAQRNYKGEVVVAFTNKQLVPMYLNCDKPNLTALSDLQLFPYFREPAISAVQNSGGSLPAGAYFVATGYEKNDGTSTPYSTVSDVILVTQDPINTGNNDKSLQITISNADTSYDYMRIAIIARVKGELTAVELTDYLPVTQDTVTLDYTGDNLTTDIDVSQILVEPAVYDQVQTIGQLNDYLYIGGLHEEAQISDMQPWANLVQLEWESNLIDVLAAPVEHRNGTKKSFMHGEVLAGYIRYHKTRGGFTRWFHTPGNAPLSDDLANSTEDIGSSEVYPVFKLQDTIHHWDPTAKTGATGIWKNGTELYPDTIDFDSTSLGGRNLRNQHVLHHKLPSLGWCHEHLYPGEAEYGKTKLDLLGIRAVNVRIPEKYQGILDGYEIGYAKRTSGNATIAGQGLMLHPTVDHYGQDKPTGQVPLYTSGGNWTTYVLHKSDNNYDDNLELVELRKDAFRFHAFDILFNKPAITPTLIHAQFKLRYEPINRGHGMIEDGDNGDDLRNAQLPYCYLLDYTQGNQPQFQAVNQRYRGISKSLYLSNTINAEEFINTRHETTFAGYLDDTATVLPLDNASAGIRIRGTGTVGEIAFEEAYLINLVTIRNDIYQNFYSQPIVSAGQWQSLSSLRTCWGGDTFCSDYTFHTYGRHDSADTSGDGTKGKKVIRRIVCETIANLGMRYEIPGNLYSKWYPVTPVSADDVNNYVTLMDRSQDPNQFGYDREFNALNDFVAQQIFSPFREDLQDFPFRIHRGGKASRTGRPRAWRTFLPLDYYEMPKDKGPIINLEGMYDTLLIHMRNALFYTRDKANLESGVLSITLGSGDIFQFEPQEAQQSKLGYAGTIHDLACVKTPVGYLFPDAKSGEVFLYSGGGKPVNLNPGLNRFLNDYLDPEGVNVLAGNGITMGWDRKYKRLLLTVKHKVLPTTIKQFSDTTDFWDNLSVNDLVQYGSRVIKYTGLLTSGCPADEAIPVVTWEPVTSFCMTNDGRQIGLQAFSSRRKLVDGVEVLVEANSPNGGEGPYFPPTGNLTDCPVTPDTITWEKRNPICLVGDGGATCPEGYTLSEDGTTCTQLLTTAPDVTSSGFSLAPSTNIVYSLLGTRFYNNGSLGDVIAMDTPDIPSYLLAGTITTGTYWANPGSTLTDGPMNRDGVWIDSDLDGVKDALTSGAQTTLSYQYFNTGALRLICLGIGGDNQFNLKVNGVTKFATTNPTSIRNFRYWHVMPIYIQPGLNNFNLIATGDGSENDSIAMVLYDNTTAELMAATGDEDLNILFRSSSLIGEVIDIATCPSGYSLDTSGGSGAYVCRLSISIPSTTTGEVGLNTGVVHWQQRARIVNGLPDGYIENNTTGANFIADETDTALCPIAPPLPETIAITGTIDAIGHLIGRSSSQGAYSLQFTLDAPSPVPLELLIGVVIKQSWDGTQLYVGSDIFTPPVGSTPWSYYAPYMGTNVPFQVAIPAGVTSFTIPYYIYQVGGGIVGAVAHGVWIYLFNTPVSELNIHLNDPASGYTLTLTSSSSIIVNNV